ncbi:MAG TPA: hypothetical protein VFB96_04950 [Pirellulaceae bacterium]|nr:hypothetical protein [Pirellulaceae bacterium]
MSSDERSLLGLLDDLLQSNAVRADIDRVVERVKRKLAADTAAVMAWEPLPLSIYRQSIPSGIASSWVFILRADAATGAERHPNSCQRMMSYQGIGDLQTGGEGNWQSHPLFSNRQAPWEQRWISIPANVWHQAVVPPDRDWVVVSFHTVAAEELIEERPIEGEINLTRQRRYVEDR